MLEALDTSDVIDPRKCLKEEIENLGRAIESLNGQIASAAVDRDRLVLLRDAVVAGLAAYPKQENEDDCEQGEATAR